MKKIDDLDKRFNKKNRDVGKLAIAKTDLLKELQTVQVHWQ